MASAQPTQGAIKALDKAVTALAEAQEDVAFKYIAKAKKKSPEWYRPYEVEGQYYSTTNQFDLAVEAYNEALERAEISSLYKAVSLCYTRLGDWDNAILHQQRYLDKAKASPRVLAAERQKLQELERVKACLAVETPTNWDLELLPFSDEKWEYFPTIMGDGKTLVFTGRDFNARYTDENFYMAQKGQDGQWSASTLIEGLGIPGLNEGASTISADGQTIVFTACNRPGGVGSCDLYITTLTNKGWSKPVLLPGNINTAQWESQPSISANGRELFFVRGINMSSDDHNIWHSTLDVDGNWSTPEKLPAPVNTKFMENSPFFHFDSQTLYFTSNRPGGLGGLDFYFTKRVEGQWAPIETVCAPMNSMGDEFSLIIAPDGKTGYLASTRGEALFSAEDDLNLYSFAVPSEMAPNPMRVYTGTVVDAVTGGSIYNAGLHIYKNGDAQLAYEGSSKPNGTFIAVLEPNAVYGFNAVAKGYLLYSDQIEITGDQEITIAMQPLHEDGKLALENMQFDTDEAVWNPSSEAELTVLLSLMELNPTWNVSIEGHTDNQGGKSYNLQLSLDRAEAVKAWLVDQGIAPERIQTHGYGDTRPVASNATEEGRAQNRRTEVRFFRN